VEKFFKLKENGTTVTTEILAGLTIFLSMAYILFVNPSILVTAMAPGAEAGSAVYNQFFGALMVATIFGAATATLVMGLYANYPFALAPGMGLNAYFTYTVVLKMGISWQIALGAIFVEGIIFILLTISGARTYVVRIIPQNIKFATSAGIGLFIAFIGLKSANIIVSNPATFVGLGDLTKGDALLAIIGLIITGVLFALRVPGSILLGIIITTIIGAFPVFGVTHYQGIVGKVPDISPTFMKLQLSWGDLLSGTFWVVVLTFFFVDFFDTLGTLTGLAQSAGFIKKGESDFPRSNKAYMADAIGTSVGALFGTSTVTTYIESETGIAQGGRTGLTSVTVAILMLLMLFFSPLGLTIPAAATAPALIFVGSLMLKNLIHITWEDTTEALPAFITIIMMPLTYSIANGIALGLVVYPLVKVFSGKGKEVHWFNWVLALAFVYYLVFLQH